MSHSSHLKQNALHLILLSALFIYTLLPAFGWVWHEVVPEHDHWFVDTTQPHVDAHEVRWQTFSATSKVGCGSLLSQTTTIHAFSPASILQSFVLLVGLSAFVVIVLLDSWSWCYMATRSQHKQIFLPLLDPPPECRRAFNG